MKTDIAIRSATLDDLPILLHHRREMFRAMGYTEPAALESLDALAGRYFQEALLKGTYHGWLAIDPAGTIVGGGGVADITLPAGPHTPALTRPEILNVYVEPHYRRCGIARQLMKVIIEWCRARGDASVFLHASDEGRALYSSMGFEPTNEMMLRVK
jgi:GNAT superfamily N-acetyltransferase